MRAAFIKLVSSLVRDETGKITQDDLETGVTLALIRYGDDRAPVVLTKTRDTLPTSDREAVACYAASVVLESLAAAAAGNSDTTIPADSVNRQSQSSEYAARAKTYRNRYFDLLGIARDRPQSGAACAVASWPPDGRFPSRPSRRSRL